MNLKTLIPDIEDVKGRHVLVTGGTTGIGRAVVRALAALGARVLTFGRDEQDLTALLEEVRAAGGEVHGITADTSRIDDVRRVFDEVDRRFGRLDVLIGNAAISGGSFEDQPLEKIEYVVRVNIAGYIACAHEAVERMRAQGSGRIVLVGSMSADLREPQGSTYVATKAAIQAFAESLRKTVNVDGIHVTLVEPGKVATDMVDRPDREKRQKIEALEMLRPEDVAAAIIFALIQPERCDVVSLAVRPHRQVI